MDNEIYLTREYQYYSESDKLEKPLKLYSSKVHKDWIDYNGHMSESFYLYAFGDASDAKSLAARVESGRFLSSIPFQIPIQAAPEAPEPCQPDLQPAESVELATAQSGTQG